MTFDAADEIGQVLRASVLDLPIQGVAPSLSIEEIKAPVEVPNLRRAGAQKMSSDECES